MCKKILYSDMAMELVPPTKTVSDGEITTSTLTLSASQAKQFGKSKGKYITIQSAAVKTANRPLYERLSKAIADSLASLGELDDALVVGLGNPYLVADSLGSQVCKRLIVTRHLDMAELPSLHCLSAIAPNVLGMTGIESYEIIKGVVSRSQPSCIIAVDSLASASVARLSSAFQVSNAGITPGSGINNHRMTLSKQTLGIPVYCIGVPLVVCAQTIVGEAGGELTDELASLVVTPKDIDLLVKECSLVISSAINTAVHGLSFHEQKNFVI